MATGDANIDPPDTPHNAFGRDILTGARQLEDQILTDRSDAAIDTTAPATSDNAGATPLGGDALLQIILKSLDDDKAEDVISIDLQGKSAMADFMVIASGRSSRQVAAMSEKLADRLKADAGVLCRSEGKTQGDWVLLDAGDVIVHIFRPEVREFYQLEKMWMAPDGTSAKA